MKKNRRGSHVGVILSFAIFIVAVVYIVSMLGVGIKNPKSQQIELENLVGGINQNLLANITSVSVYSKIAITGNCVEFQNLKNITGSGALKIYDGSGNILGYSFSGNNLQTNVSNSSERLFKIYAGGFNSSESSLESCQDILSTQYDVGLVRKKEYATDAKIKEFVDDYANNYTGLKSDLGFPLNDDFSFNFTYGNGTSVEAGEESLAKNIFSEEVQVTYFDSEGKINIGFMKIKIW